MKSYKLALLCAVLLGTVVTCGCSRLRARDQLNKGVGAYRNAQFQTAIMHFKNAVALDPTLLNARLYLATAYFGQYIPGAESPENVKVAQQAIEAFQDVPEPGTGQHHCYRQHRANELLHEEIR